MTMYYTAWCSEIGSLTSRDACNSGASSDRRGPISLHQAVLGTTCLYSILEKASRTLTGELRSQSKHAAAVYILQVIFSVIFFPNPHLSPEDNIQRFGAGRPMSSQEKMLPERLETKTGEKIFPPWGKCLKISIKSDDIVILNIERYIFSFSVST